MCTLIDIPSTMMYRISRNRKKYVAYSYNLDSKRDCSPASMSYRFVRVVQVADAAM
jgi:hypothetical protein